MENNYAIIMAGGIGSRFWPFSTTDKPKQFLDILGLGKSLIQLTFERLTKICPAENIYVVTNDQYEDLISEQLSEIPKDNILFEPVRRNTAPCVAYGCYKIHNKNPKAKILVAPSDHLIVKETEYINAIQNAFDACESDVLVTLGITPTRPDTGYGYIQATEEILPNFEAIQKVKTFTEKPDKDLAQVFFESGDFSWNSGMFIWSSESIVKSFEQNMIEIHDLFKQGFGIYGTDKEHAFIEEIYAQCVNISVDYAILEKAKNVYVLPCDIGWTDLGTWGSLYDEVGSSDENNNAVVGTSVKTYNSKNNMISNPTDKLVVIDGLDNYIVVNTDEALLVCPKDDEQKIKQFVTDLSSTKKYKKYI